MLSFPQSKTSQHSSLHLFQFCPDGREKEREVHSGFSDPQFIRINQSESVWQAQQGNLGTLFPYLLLE